MNPLRILSFMSDHAVLLEKAHAIRKEVFVNEQKVPAELEIDEYDRIARHYLVELEGKPIATARWRRTTEGIKLERFAVLKEYRGKNIGRQLVEKVLDDILIQGLKIYLHAQIQVVPFYEKVGFVIEGKPFYEASIPHCKMIYQP